MSGTRRLIRNARLIDPESGLDAPGDLLIDGDKIAAIGPGLAEAGFADDVEIVDAGGLCLAPGLVDMRVQLREPGAEHMESIETGGQAAAAGQVEVAIHHAQQLLHLDPLHEPTHRQLMRFLVQTGRRAAALAQYAVCLRVLASET